MKRKMTSNQQSYLAALLPLVLCLAIGSCKSIGSNLGDGLGEGITPHVDDVGEQLVSGAVHMLGEPGTTVTLDSLISSIVRSLAANVQDSLLGEGTEARIASIRDTAIGEDTQEQLRVFVNELFREEIAIGVAELRTNLLGSETRFQLAELRDELLGPTSRMLVADLRRELTNAESQAGVQAIAKAFVEQVSASYDSTLRPLIHEDIDKATEDVEDVVDWIRKNLTKIILALGAVIAALIALVFFLRSRRNRKMVELMTAEIDALRRSDPVAYENLKTQIQRQAVNNGVEASLRQVLEQQGILRNGDRAIPSGGAS